MKIIDFEDLTISEKINYGSYGKIYKAYLGDKLYAYKEFKEDKYLEGKKRKINQISEINDFNLLTPKFWIRKNGIINSYLTNFCFGKDVLFTDRDLVKTLKSAKDVIVRMHSYGLIHGDLISSNIMQKDGTPFIIDFDNSSFLNSKIVLKNANDYAQEYIKTFGINNSLDTHIFNLLTFSLINDCNFYMVRCEISKKNYGAFNSSEAMKICDNFFLNKTFSDSDYLIDTVDETKLII